MTPKPEQTEKQPGADRFWGQFSQTKAGRSANDSEPGPDRGSEPGPDAAAGHDAHCLEWCPICRSAELFRDTVSPELRQQAEAIQHEAIGVLKAFLDAYSEQGPGRRPAGHGQEPATGRDEREQPSTPRPTDIPLD